MDMTKWMGAVTRVRHLLLSGTLLGGVVATPLCAQRIPGVDVWLATPADSVAAGDRVPAYAVADPGAYMVVFRVTAGNHIVVVVPRTPYGGYRVPSQGLQSKGVDVSFPGSAADSTGHLFAAASYTPFDFSHVRAGGGWDATRLVAPATLAPVDAADWFLQRIVPSRRTAYSVNDVAYYVGGSPPAVARGGDQGGADNGAAYQSQNTMVYVVPGNDGLSYYSTDPWYYTGYYWYDPYAYAPRYRYKRRCPNGSVVPRNAPCPSGGVIGIPAPPGPPAGPRGRRPVPHRPYPLRTLPSQPQGHILSTPPRQPAQPGTTILVPSTPSQLPPHGGRHEGRGTYQATPRVTPVPMPRVARPAPPVIRPAPPPPAPPAHQTDAPKTTPPPPQSTQGTSPAKKQ